MLLGVEDDEDARRPSARELVLHARRRRRPPASFGGFLPNKVVYASQLRDELANINAGVEALNLEMGKQWADDPPHIPAYNDFRRWRATWKTFFDEWAPKVKPGTLIGPFGMGGAYDRTQDFRGKYDQYLQKFRGGGGTVDSPQAALPPPAADKPPPSLSFPNWGWGVIVVVGLGGVAKILHSLGVFKKGSDS